MTKKLAPLLLSSTLLLAINAHAADRCYKVTGTYTGTGTPGTGQIRPGEGVTSSWSGACDTCNGSLNLPPTINVNGAGTPLLPYLSLLATSNNIPFTTYGATAGYPDEFVFARCHPDVPVYEAYSTNGDNSLSGAVGADTWGINDAYPTAWQKIALRIYNVLASEYFTSTWKQRLLNPTATSLDKDSTGYNLVKAKNLTPISVELYLIDKTSGGWWGNSNRRYTYTQPNGYIALQAPGLSQINIGQPHIGGNWNGWHGYWPGAVGLYLNTETRFTPTCIITNNTPYINFPNVTLAHLNNNGVLDQNFSVTTQCDSGSTSGVALNSTSIGFLINPSSISKTSDLGLINSNGGASHIISVDYDDPNIAKGVGVRILRGSTALNLLTDSESALTNANLMGWYPVLEGVSAIPSQRTDTQIFTARFEKLQNQTVTTGAFTATAQIIVRLQ